MSWQTLEEAGFPESVCFAFRELSEEKEINVNGLLIISLFRLPGMRVQSLAALLLDDTMYAAFENLCDDIDREFEKLAVDMLGRNHSLIPADILELAREYNHREMFLQMWREGYNLSKRYPAPLCPD